MTEETVHPRDGQVDGEPAARASRVLPYVVATFAFAAGLATGVIIDGNAEIMHDFERTSSTAPRSAQAVQPEQAPRPAEGSASSEGQTPIPANNDVDWKISVAPGTPITPVDVRNDAQTVDLRISFVMGVPGGEPRDTAVLWVHAGKSARISLPPAQYQALISPHRSGAGYDPDAKTPVIRSPRFLLATGGPEGFPPSLAVDGRGNVKYVGPSIPQEDPPARSRTRHRSSGEYDGLGERRGWEEDDAEE